VSRDRPDSPSSSPDLPTPGSREELRQRLDRLPPSHPSSPGYRGGEVKPPRLRDFELPAPKAGSQGVRERGARPAPDPASQPDTRRQPDTDKAARAPRATDNSVASADRKAANAAHEQGDHRQPAVRRPEWQEPLARGEVDRVGPGVVDERARRFLPGERRVAEYLARTDGVAVVAFPEDHRSRDRQHDADVDGKPAEFKNLDSGADHGTVKNSLRKSIGQAPDVVVDGRDSGLSRDNAERGLRRYLGTPWSFKIDSIRIIGDDFDIRWKREESHGPDC